MDNLKVTERKIIYLDDAIDVIDNHQFSIEYCKEHNIDRAIDVSMARIALEELPSAQLEPSQVARDIATIIENEKDMRVIASAQPERKKGRWISLDDFRGKYNEFGYKCSECGTQNDYQDNFCPNCGADMRGEEE